MKLNELYKYKKLIGWGAGKHFEDVYRNVISISYLVDSDESKYGKYCKGVEIKSPINLLEEDMENVCVIIFSELYWDEIIIQIRNMGFKGDVVHESMIYPNPYCNSDVAKEAYALFAEDAVIMGMSRRYNIDIKHYIDIGANHPIMGNATFLFYLQGATGCLIEPNPKFTEVISNIRPLDNVINAGIAESCCDGEKREYYIIESLETRNTFSRDLAEYYKKRGFTISSRKIDLVSLNYVCNQYKEKINYVSIDVEGLEYDIIKDFDFKKYGIEFFNIEKSNPQIIAIMENNGYELVCQTPSNWIFALKGIIKEKI